MVFQVFQAVPGEKGDAKIDGFLGNSHTGHSLGDGVPLAVQPPIIILEAWMGGERILCRYLL